jgi:hypothetical protein
VLGAATSAIDQDYRGGSPGWAQLHSGPVNRRSRIPSILTVTIVAVAVAGPPPVSGIQSATASARKCKRSAPGKRRCKRRRRRAVLSISPPGHDFGTIGYADSAPVDLVVTNTGSRRSGTPAAVLSGSGTHYFRVNGTTCSAPLPPRASCAVTVQSVGNDGATGLASLDISAAPGGTASAPLVVNIF